MRRGLYMHTGRGAGSANPCHELDIPLHADPIALRLMAQHDGPVPSLAIARAYNVSRQAVDAAERKALRAFRRACALHGLDAKDVASHLQQRQQPTHWERMADMAETG